MEETQKKWHSRYGWKVVDELGKFMMLPISSLGVDREYQRGSVSMIRVRAIAREWSWAGCGCIVVGRRSDGTYWVLDGQHRTVAASLVDGLMMLPCLVFDVEGKCEEARAFVTLNTVRGGMSMLAKYKAMLVAKHETAIAVRDAVESRGRHVADDRGANSVACVGCLMKMHDADPALLGFVIDTVFEVCDGSHVTDRIFKGVWALEKAYQRKYHVSAFTVENVRRLKIAGVAKITRSMESSVAFNGGGGDRSYALGVVQVINYRCKHRLLDI